MIEIYLDWDVVYESFHTTRKWEQFNQNMPKVVEMFGEPEIWSRKSASGRTHLKLIFEKDISTLDQFILRASLGDDYARVYLDLKRIFHHGVEETNRIFDWKVVGGEKFEAGPWTKLPYQVKKKE
jgi:hypothetical protein